MLRRFLSTQEGVYSKPELRQKPVLPKTDWNNLKPAKPVFSRPPLRRTAQNDRNGPARLSALSVRDDTSRFSRPPIRTFDRIDKGKQRADSDHRITFQDADRSDGSPRSSGLQRDLKPRRTFSASKSPLDIADIRRRRQNENAAIEARKQSQAALLRRDKRRPKFAKVQRKVEIPSLIAVSNLAVLLKIRFKRLQNVMAKIGIADARPDRMLTSDDSTLIALEFDIEPIIDDEKAFDVYPSALVPEKLKPRPPIVAVMGHVDHGKTTLLDALRSSSVAAGEAGGITQHIGAFQVPLSALLRSKEPAAESAIQKVTFLDTPGHAAFKAMRSRGRDVTDIVVLVVAADDGVKAQTQEVVDLIKNGQGGADESVGVVVAVTKCDKPDADPRRAKASLAGAGLVVEDQGGDVPCVEVSAMSKAGLPDLLEMITTVAEVRDLKAENDGVRAQGYIIESQVHRGRGIVATVLVSRGTLKTGMDIIAGTSRCRVRQMMSASGASIKEALPGQPVEIAGWRDFPHAGDVVLGTNDEDEARKAVEARKRRLQQDEMLSDVEAINAKRKEAADQESETKAATKSEAVVKDAAKRPEVDSGPKKFSMIIKADVNGSEEALVGALEGIGNNEAKADIIHSGVGEVSETDLERAKTANAAVIAFNVPCSRAMETKALSLGVEIIQESIIYRIIDQIIGKVTDLLPKIIQSKIVGEATILQVFSITIKGRQTEPVAGCRIKNGTVSKTAKVRIVRDGQDVWSGTLATLKHHKNDVQQMAKGMECGMSFAGFETFEAGDTILSIEEFEVKRSL